eukprot:TRINITY_DN1880_c0_g1_i1.p1 TRINITY_DN1880_c0_g1~~TRINITY_DN1880_c0_g1_i1.p1  ORF type:complete len:447 (+),score=151.78 TRINITY_DN1880_c0_g1_i1:60-1400(+)
MSSDCTPSSPRQQQAAAAPALGCRVDEDDTQLHCLADLRCMFNRPQFSDLRIRVNEATFYVHQMVLASFSTVFEAMLAGWAEKDQDVLTLDEDPDLVEQLLRFMYSHSVSEFCSTLPRTIGLYSLADKYDVGQLRRKLSLMLLSATPSAQLCELYELVEPYTALRELVFNRLLGEFEAVWDGRVGRLTFPSLRALIGSHQLLVSSESRVWWAVLNWIKQGPERPRTQDVAEGRRQRSCTTLDDYERSEHAAELFALVRYHLMTPEELCTVQGESVFPFSVNCKDLLLDAYRRVHGVAEAVPTNARCRSIVLQDVTAQKLRAVRYLESRQGPEWKLSCDTNGDEVCLSLSYKKQTTPYNIECYLALRCRTRMIAAQFNRTTSTEEDQAHSWGYTVFCKLATLGDDVWTAEALFRIAPAGPEWFTKPAVVDFRDVVHVEPERIEVPES